MSAFGGKADSLETLFACPLIARSGHSGLINGYRNWHIAMPLDGSRPLHQKRTLVIVELVGSRATIVRPVRLLPQLNPAFRSPQSTSRRRGRAGHGLPGAWAEACLVWKRVLATVKEIQRQEPEEGEAVN